jgi:hypothetical protein
MKNGGKGDMQVTPGKTNHIHSSESSTLGQCELSSCLLLHFGTKQRL